MKSPEEGGAVGRITVVGSYAVALVMDVDRIPAEGETVMGRGYRATHGGKGSNMACCAARLGADVRLVTRVGADAFGDGLIALLGREGVDPNWVLRSASLPTAVGMILGTSLGTNAIAVDAAALSEFLPEDVAPLRETIHEGDAVLSPLEIPLETALAASRMARERGAFSILNPAPASDLRRQDLSTVDFLTPNETEARVCLGLAPDDPIEDLTAAEQLRSLGARNVIVTRGGKGVLWLSPDGCYEIPALAVNVIDTVGAGDAFNAGLAVGLCEGREPLEAVLMGVVTASLSTEKRETIDSYPRRAEVDARLPHLRDKIRRLA
jgi:ribokinase